MPHPQPPPRGEPLTQGGGTRAKTKRKITELFMVHNLVVHRVVYHYCYPPRSQNLGDHATVWEYQSLNKSSSTTTFWISSEYAFRFTPLALTKTVRTDFFVPVSLRNTDSFREMS